ncbi:hypothetical protein GALL_480620 [mine drainage metagenome]|uniref:Uncharacterized protein n=1 Tax=mine drainage metagenome TaxID=410659 RepID=A0A1J5PFZ8_9ZZZZ
MVLAGEAGAVEQFGGGGALVRLEPATFTKVNQRVRLFCAGGHDAAGAVVFEAAADHHLIVGQQGGGERVALKPTQPLAVKRKFLRRGAVDQATTFGETGAHL